MDSDFGVEQQAPGAVPDSKTMANHHSSFNSIFNTIDTIICDEAFQTGEFREMNPKNPFGGGPAGIMDGSFCSDTAFATKFLQRPSFSALMADESSDADTILDSSKDSFHTVNLNALGVKNGLNSTDWNHLEAIKLGAEVSKFNIGSVTPSALVSFPSDPAFLERAVKFSSFGGNTEHIAHENVIGGASNPRTVAENGANGCSEPAKCPDDGVGKKRRAKSSTSGQNNTKESEESRGKRCRVGENSESDDNTSESTPQKGKDKNSRPLQKEDNYIHVRARRGQATDSHSLAERVRREKINERMKFLQDLVPTCNKVTGKAVMLDEIINYVQSLQHQVEFLSMKLATVNPKLDFNIDNLFSKEMCGSFASKGMPPPFFHLEQFKHASLQAGPNPGSEILSALSSADSAEMFDGPNFQRQSSSGELANMYNVGMLQGRVQQVQQQQQPPL
ncbi:hypothetical protein SUGI_1175410 [Cryptomeria japonica]|uniref:transcription factor bHLH63 n=1 Tax=Cryptomeria japonica TaxID=3369 RepID=UPI0024148F3C|nr:transcription factor bHLH63 [Cryptomeria japonica]XP_057862043.2 transcription factor bHLH63 [Cryptomeria japonica]XP_057862044.2 transcription factor bHLH63 [Cryptomeria japonica]GLJ54718.1 hypothetical protein SUGI_1175410 [Cryptomeria japonica]